MHRLALHERCQQLQRQRRAGQRQRRCPRLAARVWERCIATSTVRSVARSVLCACRGICTAGLSAECADQVVGKAGRQCLLLDERVECGALAAA